MSAIQTESGSPGSGSPGSGSPGTGDPHSQVHRLTTSVSFIGGAAGLLCMTFSDSIAVIGRHTGWPFLGAIEVVEAAIVLMASSAMLMATANKEHATIRILTNRVSPRHSQMLLRLSHFISALFCCSILIGSLWIACETFGEYERSELLHIPFLYLRVFSILCMTVITVLFVVSALKRKSL